MTAHFVGIMRRAFAAVSFLGRVAIFSEIGEVFMDIDKGPTTV